MQEIGPVTKFRELAQIYHGVTEMEEGQFVQLPSGLSAQVKKFRSKNLRYIDWRGIRYVEQNPNSRSAYAARARQGAKIVWCIRLRDNQYLGRIEQDQVFMKEQAWASRA